tara:strand:+ start:968 stop:1258 length:291 start_codon:yes stop_codon:yes gene_type:complete
VGQDSLLFFLRSTKILVLSLRKHYNSQKRSGMNLPNSPIRKISQCPKCGEVSLKFYNPQFNKVFKKEEWENILSDGLQALRKILGPVTEDPKFFTD